MFGVNHNVLHAHPGAAVLYTTTWLWGAQNSQLGQLPTETGSLRDACNLSCKLFSSGKTGVILSFEQLFRLSRRLFTPARPPAELLSHPALPFVAPPGPDSHAKDGGHCCQNDEKCTRNKIQGSTTEVVWIWGGIFVCHHE